MGAVIFKIFILLLILVLPLSGPVRRKRNDFNENNQNEFYSNYSINEDGHLEITRDDITPNNNDIE
ncbi:MAG: hypothetical protein ABI367_03995 [Mucilaginibacter sp.]